MYIYAWYLVYATAAHDKQDMLLKIYRYKTRVFLVGYALWMNSDTGV